VEGDGKYSLLRSEIPRRGTSAAGMGVEAAAKAVVAAAGVRGLGLGFGLREGGIRNGGKTRQLGGVRRRRLARA